MNTKSRPGSDQPGSALSFLQRSAKSAPADSAEPWDILVVDDDPTAHAVVRMALSQRRFLDRPLRLRYAHSVDEALVMLDAHPETAVALLDVVMERGDDGLQLARTIRNDARYNHVRLVVHTGQPGRISELDAVLNYPVDGYLSKAELSADRLFAFICTQLRTCQLLKQMA